MMPIDDDHDDDDGRHSFFSPSSRLSRHLSLLQIQENLTFKNSWMRPRSSWLSCVMYLASSRGQKAASCCWEGESDEEVGAIAIACCSLCAGAARCLARTASRSDISVRGEGVRAKRAGVGEEQKKQ